MKWPEVKVGNFLTVQNGFAFQSEYFSVTSGTPLIRIRDLAAASTEINYDGPYREEFLVRPGDYLIGMDGDFACHQWTGPEALLNQRVCRLTQFSKYVHPRFVFYRIQQELAAIQRKTSFVTVKHLSSKQIELITFPLPSISEQLKIVEILDQANTLRKKRTEADAKADRILPALFYKMFGNPTKDSPHWGKSTLGDFSLEFRYGTSTKCGVEQVGLPVLRIPNVIGGEVDLSDLKYAALSDDEADRLLLEPGDILFVRTNGNPAYVGRCAIFNLAERYIFASYLIRARIDLKRADPCFVTEYLRTSEGRRTMAPYIRTTAGQSNISVEGLRQLPVLLPPLTLQKKFGGFVGTIQASRRKSEQARSVIRNLFNSMLHHAYSGNLTAKWREAHIKELMVEMEKQTEALSKAC